MARAAVYDETLDQALEKMRAVRQIRRDSVMEDFGRQRIQEMMKIRLTPPGRRPAGWAEFRTLIHAMVKGEDGVSMPLSV